MATSLYLYNILTGASNIDDLRKRVTSILDVCVKHNVKLKFAKTHLGHKTAKFFGYELTETGYRIDANRKQALAAIPMPGWGSSKRENQKQIKNLDMWQFTGLITYVKVKKVKFHC